MIQIKSERGKVGRRKGEEWDYEMMLWHQKKDFSNLPIFKRTDHTNMENSPNKTKRRQKTSKGSKTTKNVYSVVEPKSRIVHSLLQNLKPKNQRFSINFQRRSSKITNFHEEDHKNKMAHPNLEWESGHVPL